jgi:hypothetical protein
MLKRIPKSDISIRPFKAYKEWDKTSASASLLIAEEGSYSSTEATTPTIGYLNGIAYNKHSLFGQLKAQFYNGNEDNPFLRFGDKTNEYETASAARDRFLSGSAKVISIPQIAIGEGIKKGSAFLIDGNKTYVDDTYGNMIDAAGDNITVVAIDNEINEIRFTDLLDVGYTASFQTAVGDFDITNETFNLVYDGVNYDMNIVSFDINNGLMVVENIPFLQGAAGVSKIGNIFYTQGLIVITRNVNDLLLGSWNINYKSTKTIYEHEYLLIVNEDEFNTSQNPSAIVEVGKVDEYITGSDGKIYKTTTTSGVKYIRKLSTLENGNTLDFRFTGSYSSSAQATYAGFEHYDLSGSMDSTGSFLAPYITTIGLYDDNCDLVAVAKLPQPIKSEPEIPVNFIIRFDT